MLVVDYSWSHPTPAAIRAAGYVGAMRYLSTKRDAKVLSAAERDDLHAAGLAIGLIWQVTKDEAKGGHAAGVDRGRWASDMADQLGYPAAAPQFFAVDYEATGLAVQPYFDGIATTCRRDVGAYGTYDVVEQLRGVPWLWQCQAWSKGRISERAHLYQRVGHTSPARASLGTTDENRLYRPLPLWLPGGAVMWINPAVGRISSPYGPRPAPLPSPHLGTDVANATGTPLKAAAAGEVVYAGTAGTGLATGRSGLCVIIRHADADTYYGHLSRIDVKAGQRVSAGQRIGLMGATGNVTGPHLHFEVRPVKSKIGTTDPVPYLKARGVTLGTDPYTVAYVREVQDLLNLAAGAGLARDGDLGPRTIAAVESFQRTAGLVVDGDPGPRTLAALRAAAGQTTTPDPAPVPVPEEDPLMAVADTIEAALAQGKEGERPAGWVEILLTRIAADTAAARTAAEAALAKVDALALATGVTPDALADAVRGALDGAALVLDTTPEG